MNQLITGKYVELKNNGSVIFSSVGTLTAWPREMFSQLQLPLSLLTASATPTVSHAVQTSVERHSYKIIYSCWHRRWHRSAVLHLSRPQLCRTWRPGILEFHISISITDTICTRLTSCIGITGLWRVCFSVCSHLTAGREIISARISKLTEPLNKLIGYLKRNNLVKLYQNTTFDNRAKQSVSDSESEQ